MNEGMTRMKKEGRIEDEEILARVEEEEDLFSRQHHTNNRGRPDSYRKSVNRKKMNL